MLRLTAVLNLTNALELDVTAPPTHYAYEFRPVYLESHASLLVFFLKCHFVPVEVTNRLES
jgi:hypothetical protein